MRPRNRAIPEAIAHFINTVPQDKWTEHLQALKKNNQHMTLPDGAGFTSPNDKGAPFCHTIFVRECYSSFYSKFNQRTTAEHMVLTGRPGLGKSMFGAYTVLRKTLEMLTDEGREEDFKMLYVVNDMMAEIRIPVELPERNNNNSLGLVKLKCLTRTATHNDISESSWLVVDPVTHWVAELAADAMAAQTTDHNEDVILCVCSPGLLKKTEDPESPSGVFGHTRLLPFKPWDENEMNTFLHYYAQNYNVYRLTDEMNFCFDLQDMLGDPAKPDPHGFFKDLVFGNFRNSRLKRDAKQLCDFLNPDSSESEDPQLSYKRMTEIVIYVLSYRYEVVGCSVRDILKGNVRTQLLTDFEKTKTSKRYLDCVADEPDGYLNFRKTYTSKTKGGSIVVARMLAVRAAVSSVRTYLKKSTQGAMSWLEHEKVCRYTFAPENEHLNYQFFFTTCDKNKKKREEKQFSFSGNLSSEEVVGFFTKSVKSLRENHYYACCKGQPVVDGVAYTTNKMPGFDDTNRPKMLLIQATVSKRHEVKITPLKKIVDHLLKLLNPRLKKDATVRQQKMLLKKVNWYFIFFIATQNFQSTQFEPKVEIPVEDMTSNDLNTELSQKKKEKRCNLFFWHRYLSGSFP